MLFYEAFGLEPALSLDADELKKRFYERSRQWHPDRFSRASAAEQQKALEMTSTLNDAFRTLRDPIARAEYFLKEKGIELSKEAPPELLEEIFELNMALEELRDYDESADYGAQLHERRSQFAEARARFLAMRDSIDQSIASTADLKEIGALLNRRRYISNLIRDVENVLPN
jgi:molecular chaperone HscB